VWFDNLFPATSFLQLQPQRPSRNSMVNSCNLKPAQQPQNHFCNYIVLFATPVCITQLKRHISQLCKVRTQCAPKLQLKILRKHPNLVLIITAINRTAHNWNQNFTTESVPMQLHSFLATESVPTQLYSSLATESVPKQLHSFLRNWKYVNATAQLLVQVKVRQRNCIIYFAHFRNFLKKFATTTIFLGLPIWKCDNATFIFFCNCWNQFATASRVQQL
jgi:hypothetical protein